MFPENKHFNSVTYSYEHSVTNTINEQLQELDRGS